MGDVAPRMNSTVFRLQRSISGAEATKGCLICPNGAVASTLEDAFHPVKIRARTRISAGTYTLGFHQSPRFGASYRKRLVANGISYRGMIHIRGVPNFEWVLIHCGNTVDDTDGCILVGESVIQTTNGMYIPGGQTWPAFFLIYPIIASAIEQGGATVQILDP